MTRSPAFLAALASAAVSGLDPASARVVRPTAAAEFDIAFVTDTQDRRWVVRSPRSITAGARLESSVALLALLARRVPFQVPVPKGFAETPEGRAAVYPYLPGSPLDLPQLPAGPELAASVGQVVAALHRVDRRLFDEAGVPSYEADELRGRRLADLDRAAATGHVPTALLSRWENALDDVTLWRFAPTPVHGDLGGDQLLAVFASDDDATSGAVTAITGWEDAKVADPAVDLAAVVATCSPEAAESVLEAYAQARGEAVDPHLRRRALLAWELGLLGRLLSATVSGAPALVREYAGRLRRLAEQVQDDDLAPPPPAVVVPKPLTVPAAAVAGSAEADDPEATGAYFDLRNSGPSPTAPGRVGGADPGDADPGAVEADQPGPQDEEAGAVGGAPGSTGDGRGGVGSADSRASDAEGEGAQADDAEARAEDSRASRADEGSRADDAGADQADESRAGEGSRADDAGADQADESRSAAGTAPASEPTVQIPPEQLQAALAAARHPAPGERAPRPEVSFEEPPVEEDDVRPL